MRDRLGERHRSRSEETGNATIRARRFINPSCSQYQQLRYYTCCLRTRGKAGTPRLLQCGIHPAQVSNGSNSALGRCRINVRNPPESVRRANIDGRPRSAIFGLVRRNIRRVYSITSSARASNGSGISRPSALAVLRLMTSSNLVGCSTGKVGRLGAFQDLVDVGGGSPELLQHVGRVGHETQPAAA